MYRAKRSSPLIAVGGSVVFAVLILWALRHIQNLLDLTSAQVHTFTVIYAMSFAVLAWQTVLYSIERPYKAKTNVERQQLKQLRVVANVPVCNEDAKALADCLKSMVLQTHPPAQIQVVVNGPNKIDYTKVEKYAQLISAEKNVPISWVQQDIAGKRAAQARTAREYLGNDDIFLTVDSDAYLDAKAIEEGIKPFLKHDIMSVAGVVLTMNSKHSFIARMSDLWFQVGQLVDRSANSTLGAVLVNSGVLALYRAPVILDNLEGYTSEYFFGHKIEFSDDSLLTLYALQRGKAVQQPTSFAFTLMPEKLSHHFRQQLRWMRGAFIRSWWRFKYLPLRSYAYWQHLIGWVQMFLSLGLFAYLFVWMPLFNARILPWLLLIPLCVGYGQGLRYLTITRNDETFWYRFTTYLMQPIPSLWSFFVLRFVRYYAIATWYKTGWGTRQDVEVAAATAH